MKPIYVEEFFHDGRGPELQRIHWGPNGVGIRELAYFNPDDAHGPANLKRVIVTKPQVVMITPEEVVDYGKVGGDALVRHRPAAMFDLGASDWLKSFSPRHLGACRHFRMFFYDELVDIIAEGVECRRASTEDAG
ncbi:MAG: hypothetical protein ACOYM9_11720 [Bradymonadia bacterium]